MIPARALVIREPKQPRLPQKLHSNKAALMSLPFDARAIARNLGKAAVKGSCSPKAET
jgi:hypothetical protein